MSNYFPTFKRLMKKRLFRKLSWIKIGIIIILIASLITIKDEIEYIFGIGYYSDDGDYSIDSDIFYEECSVQGLMLRGDLVTFASETPEYLETASEDIVYSIQMAEEDPSIRAIILEVDSYGGYPVADEEIADALERATKPTIALVRGAAASAAYYAATGADIIFASQDSEIGSIGTTLSYLDYSQKNKIEGATFNELSTGKFKDMLNEDKVLTWEEKQLIMRDLNIMNDNFIEAVAENREMSTEDVRKLADGSTMLGKMALEEGLIDRIGGEYEVKEYLREMIGEEIEICW